MDLSFLEKFTKGDSKKMKRYISLYLDVAPKTIAEMEQNLKVNDWEQLRINAHSLKPQADFMGLADLKEKLIQIEKAVYSKHLDNILSLFDESKKLSEKSAASLQSVLDKF
jgi:HPt (histidine-containing phosphotransfer) domain-containing protein